MNSAVLVIDVQKVLFEPKPQPFDANDTIYRINQVTEWARSRSAPVIFIQHEKANSVIAHNSVGWELESGLIALASDYYSRKTTPDAFLNTDLQLVLEKLNIKHLIICGYASEFCVDVTAKRAAGLGYSITLVSDGHTTHDKPHLSGVEIREHHNATLPFITSFGVKIEAVSTQDILLR